MAKNPPAKRVILTGDDFGLALPVNDAIIRAHRDGLLTSASLMMGSDHCADAVERAHQCPTLRVGLHLTLVEGRPVAPRQLVPDLIDSNGEFSTRLARAGCRFFFLPGVRRQLATEIRAQFAAFAQTGLPLDHADAHNHMHLHPTVLTLMLEVGREYGLRAVRLPREAPLASWRATGTGLTSRLVTAGFLAPWSLLMKKRLRLAGIRCNDHLFGMTDSGAMTEATVRGMVRHLPPGVTEFCFHLATRRAPEIDRTMPLYHHEDELRVLQSAWLRRELDAAGAETVAFSDL